MPARGRLLRDLRRAASNVYTSRPDLESYTYDAQGQGEPPLAVVLPETTGEVSSVVSAVSRHGVAVVPRGAGTNLCGGTLVSGPSVVLCTTRMRRLIELCPDDHLAVVEPGITNEDLQKAAGRHGLFFPPDPASLSVATIGGNIAQNAGGMRGFKYGVTGDYVLGLEVVLADGTVVNTGGPHAGGPGPDATGLIVGSEGTLGIVTRALLRLLPVRPRIRTIIAIFDSMEDAGIAVQRVVASGTVPVAMELIDRVILSAVSRNLDMDELRGAEAMLLVELDGFDESVDAGARRMLDFVTASGGRDVRLATSESERDRLWLARRNASASVSVIRPGFLEDDITVPRGRLVEMLSRIGEISRESGLPIGNVFHAGDGNFHPLILFDDSDPGEAEAARAANREIAAAAVSMGGTISGEHGIGLNKLGAMAQVYSPGTLEVMRRVKLALDPRETLNPGKAVPRADSGHVGCEGGGRAWVGGGGTSIPPPDGAVVRSAEWHGRPEIDRANLTVTAGASLTLGQLEIELSREGLFFPAGRWEPRASTLGGLVARGITGPGQHRYRRIADLVLGMTMVTGDGVEISPGGRTIKNAAGYGLSRLAVGSLGTLGMVTGLCLRVFPVPFLRRWLALDVPDAGIARAVSRDITHSAEISSLVVMRGIEIGQISHTRPVLLVELEGDPESLASALDAVNRVAAGGGLKIVHDADGDEIDRVVRSRLEEVSGAPGFGGAVLAAMEPHGVFPTVTGPAAGLAAWVIAHPLDGALEAGFSGGGAGAVRDIASAAPGGHAVTRQGLAWPAGFPLVDCPDRTRFGIARAAKRAFDPGGVLPSLPVGRDRW